MPVYDTYAWIEYFRGSEKGAVVKQFPGLPRRIYSIDSLS